MTKQEILETYHLISRCIEDRRLKEAFDKLNTILSNLQNWQLKEKLKSLEDTYKMMLNYLVENAEDPQREAVFADLIRSVYRVADAAFLQLMTSNDNTYFYERKRSLPFAVSESSEQLIALLDELTQKIDLAGLLEDQAPSSARIAMEKQKEELMRKSFLRVWLSDLWDGDEYNRWAAVMKNPINPTPWQCLIITALTLSLQEVFDERKALLLFESATLENEEVRQRALTGIILFLRQHNDRLKLYPSLTGRLQHLAENSRFRHDVRHIILQFILSRETEKITRKITEELLPEMMKMSPKLRDKIKLDDLMNESGFNEKNPEWQELINETGLSGKLQELTEWQMEGADVMHSSFVHLKNYSFFNEISNWFLPFSMPADNMGDTALDGIAKMLMDSKILCNSDKYSFYYSIYQMPESYRKMMTGQFSSESGAMQEMLKEELKDHTKQINPIARQYLQDLYRFYKLHARRRDFDDIFEAKPEFYQVPSIAALMDSESLFIVGEYYFNKNYFDEANDIYDRLLAAEPKRDVLYQKKGYCLQMTGDIEGALDNYLTADLLQANNSWTVKKIAYCYRMLKQPEQALTYYQRALQLTPDNLSLQLNVGHCHLELKQYDEALKSYFKVEYLSDKKERAWRPIGWCSFLTGKFEQALDYFNRIIATKPNSTDYLNVGHVCLAMNNKKEAIRMYELAWKHAHVLQPEFIESFLNDVPDLVTAGVKAEEIPFILDRIMYEI